MSISIDAVEQWIDESIEQYLDWMQDTGERYRVTLPGGWYAPDQLHASDIGQCPLQAAFRREEIEPDFPELVYPSESKWLMALGTRAGEIIQEALSWSAERTKGYEVKVEPQVKFTVPQTDIQIVGRLDLLMTSPIRAVIELKNSNARTLFESHVWQTFAYMQGTNTDYGFIVKMPRTPHRWTVYTVRRTDKGHAVFEGKVLVDADWNVPGFPDNLFHLYAIEHQSYWQAIKDGLEYEHPYRSPLHHWACLKRLGQRPHRYVRDSKQYGYKCGDIRIQSTEIRCPWFSKCWGYSTAPMISLDKNDNEIPLWPMEERSNG